MTKYVNITISRLNDNQPSFDFSGITAHMIDKPGEYALAVINQKTLEYKELDKFKIDDINNSCGIKNHIREHMKYEILNKDRIFSVTHKNIAVMFKYKWHGDDFSFVHDKLRLPLTSEQIENMVDQMYIQLGFSNN